MKLSKILLIALLAMGVLFVAAEMTSALAQEAADTAAPAPDEDGEVSITFFQLLRLGGAFMIPLIALSVATVGLVIYNAIMLREKNFIRPEVVQTLREQLESVDVEGARQTCEENPCVVANIVSAGLDRITSEDLDPAFIEKAMEESSAEELNGPYLFISLLSIIATISPMVGLLGTVSGMIKAFRNIAFGGMGRPEELATNISEALMTTASGLSVGIPAMFAFFFFKTRYAKMSAQIARYTGDCYHALVDGVKRSANG
ncbi:MAG: MotA/TolQ/ExbB proton channel family protein [Opitutales bacterium]|nr:MotA/TolQ/ExbB proton channel family protein [Opitutales bacterium]MCH8540466.1 MotA/TolQ/ExbB proton channel family protein [Opitutales bacterium]